MQAILSEFGKNENPHVSGFRASVITLTKHQLLNILFNMIQ